MQSSPLYATSLVDLVDQCVQRACAQTAKSTLPRVVVSPYRFNPLGAHIDHQGGSVLARCLDQYTLLCFWPSESHTTTLRSDLNNGQWESASFNKDELVDQFGWDAMARASVTAFADYTDRNNGIDAVVFGTLVSGGLSSSASVILAYLTALAAVNDVELSAQDLVELSRRVENDYRGLNNGIQDQMSIAFAQKNHMMKLDMQSVSAHAIADAENHDDVSFLMCYSGVSRDLIGSNFNTRVAECQQAAQTLDSRARHLGEVPPESRDKASLAKLPAALARRAQHVYTEMRRVDLGMVAWREGDWRKFGQLMNESCKSSIHDYESGSPWLIDLHKFANGISGVFGNRFSGGGYGGCLFMLVESSKVDSVSSTLLELYLDKYPDKSSAAFVKIAQSESTVRVIDL